MNKQHYVLGLATLTLAILGCSGDFLDRQPYGVLNEGDFFKTNDAGIKLVTSCYQPMLDGWGYSVNKVALGDEVVDNADAGGSDPGDRPQTTEVGTGRPLTSNPLLLECWSNRYNGIGKCNIALDAITRESGNLVSGGVAIPPETVARYLAEIRFLRAWYYFDLITVFKEVPLVTTVEETATRKEKAAITELREQLYSDLDAAINEPNFPRLKQLAASEAGRASKDAAFALKARVALFFAGLMEQGRMDGDATAEYTTARTAAGEVVNNGGLSLLPDFQDLYRGDYETGPFSSENIFGVLRDYNPAFGLGGDAFAIMNVGRNNVGGYGGNTPTRDLAASYSPTDPRKLFTIISHNDIFRTSSGGQEVHNYQGYFNDYNLQHSRKAFVPQQYRENNDLLRSNWQPYWLRYAEVLLIYAEASLKSNGNAAEVAERINEVRRRAFVTTSKTDDPAVFRKFAADLKPINGSLFESTYAVKTSDDLLTAIKRERRAELALEGLRLYDLIRWGDYASTMQAFYETYGFAGKGRNADANSWPFPIPQIEIDRSNGKLTQHPNY